MPSQGRDGQVRRGEAVGQARWVAHAARHGGCMTVMTTTKRRKRGPGNRPSRHRQTHPRAAQGAGAQPARTRPARRLLRLRLACRGRDADALGQGAQAARQAAQGRRPCTWRPAGTTSVVRTAGGCRKAGRSVLDTTSLGRAATGPLVSTGVACVVFLICGDTQTRKQQPIPNEARLATCRRLSLLS